MYSIKTTIVLLLTISFVSAQKDVSSVFTPDTSGKKLTIKGIVEQGVEAGCIILKTKENKTYLLLNLKTGIKYGTCIKATGYIQKSNINICMQGVPFYVINYCPCDKKSKPKYQRDLPKERIQK